MAVRRNVCSLWLYKGNLATCRCYLMKPNATVGMTSPNAFSKNRLVHLIWGNAQKSRKILFHFFAAPFAPKSVLGQNTARTMAKCVCVCLNAKKIWENCNSFVLVIVLCVVEFSNPVHNSIVFAAAHGILWCCCLRFSVFSFVCTPWKKMFALPVGWRLATRLAPSIQQSKVFALVITASYARYSGFDTLKHYADPPPPLPSMNYRVICPSRVTCAIGKVHFMQSLQFDSMRGEAVAMHIELSLLLHTSNKRIDALAADFCMFSSFATQKRLR